MNPMKAALLDSLFLRNCFERREFLKPSSYCVGVLVEWSGEEEEEEEREKVLWEEREKEREEGRRRRRKDKNKFINFVI